jgi:hypothetical protein
MAAAAVFAASCGQSEETGSATAEVNARFANDNEARQIHSIHVWALRTPSGEDAELPPPRLPTGPRASTACGNLVGHAISPYDRYFTMLADRVFFVPDEMPPVLEELPAGEIIVYLEAVDFLGASRFSGCRVVEVADGGSVTVDVEVVRPGTFDCGDPVVEDDAPCDDGLRCTVGERCRAGACSGGRERSCASVQDACNSATCTEELGCQAEPLPDGTSCAGESICTVGEVCQAGVCIGAPRDCSEEVLACQFPACDEELGCIATGQLDFGTPCDDGLFCTVSTTCDFTGACVGGAARDCSEELEACDIPACSEEDGCFSAGTRTSGACDDNICLIGQQCNAEGNCVGGIERNCAAELTLDACEAAACDPDLGCVPDGPAPEGTPCDAVVCDPGQQAECDGSSITSTACVCVDDNGGDNG